VEVDREYEGALTEVSDALAGAKGQKQKATGEALQVARRQAEARQSAWLQRASQQTSGAWRPKATYRKSVYRWCRNVENQMRLHLGIDGF
jgi:L-rhamnose isomerase